MRMRLGMQAAVILLVVGAGALPATATDRVLLLIDQSLYNQVETRLLRYENDVEGHFAVQLELHVGDFESDTPEEIRTYLRTEYFTRGFEGVILAGQIPYIVWRQDPEFGSNYGQLAFFYEDLDGAFFDQDDDGEYDYHTWGTNDGPEVWSCWMRPPVMDEAGYLNDLLDEAHDYYSGSYLTTKQGYVACHGDYDGNFWGGTIPSMPALVGIYGSGNVGTDGEDADPVVASELESQIFGQGYEIVHFWSHASSTLQAWDSGYIRSSDVMTVSANTGPLIAHIYGCHSGDFIGYEGTATWNTNIAIAYAFGPGAGQASSGTSWSYGTEGMCFVTEEMKDGAYLGATWKHLLDLRENSVAIQQRYQDRDVRKELSGNNLFGNPFLYADWIGGPITNYAPEVNCGDNMTVQFGTPATLNATVTDDGQPTPPSLTYFWRKLSGPGVVTFDDPYATATTATFSLDGTYELQLEADDGDRVGDDRIVITVPPPNYPPTVDAGPDRAVYLPDTITLDATVSDDGTPDPPGAVTLQWRQIAGPGTASFGSPTAEDTTVTFDEAGDYELELEAYDGELYTVDTVLVTVYEPSPRVTSGLVAYYTFDEAQGTVVHDWSGYGDALDLTISDDQAAQWTPGGLRLDTPVRVLSDAAASDVIDACKASGEVTLEAWVKPANLTQTGPARILTISVTNSSRNIMLGQDADTYTVRVRTSDGEVSLVTDPNDTPVTTDLRQVVFTRAASGDTAIYLDTVLVAAGSSTGNFSTWNSGYRLGVGNEVITNAPWLGEIRLAAIYDRALSPAEITQNFEADVEPPDKPGDMDCNGQVDYFDINPFLEALDGEASWPYPDCPWLNADCDGDGDVDYFDINPFLGLLGT